MVLSDRWVFVEENKYWEKVLSLLIITKFRQAWVFRLSQTSMLAIKACIYSIYSTSCGCFPSGSAEAQRDPDGVIRHHKTQACFSRLFGSTVLHLFFFSCRLSQASQTSLESLSVAQTLCWCCAEIGSGKSRFSLHRKKSTSRFLRRPNAGMWWRRPNTLLFIVCSCSFFLFFQENVSGAFLHIVHCLIAALFCVSRVLLIYCLLGTAYNS